MREWSFFLVVAVTGTVLAQAPVEDRRGRGDAVADAQQRLEFSRRAAAQADERVAQAEQNMKEAERALESVRKQYDEAKAQADRANRDLTEARAKARELRRAYEQESAEFDRLRRGAPERGRKD